MIFFIFELENLKNIMTKENAIKLFQDQRVRVHWSDEEEKWFFSIVDIIGVLTESINPNNYWKVLKSRLKKEGSELVTNCNQLKMESSDGKFYKTDVADTEQLLKINSIYFIAKSRTCHVLKQLYIKIVKNAKKNPAD